MNYSQQTKKYFLFILVAYVFFAQTTVFAADSLPAYRGVSDQIKQYLCAPTDASNDANGTNSASSDLYKCINQLYKFAIALGGTIAVFFVVVAGYIYMSADGNQESLDKAKDILTSSITAMVILLGGYLLLKAINPDLIEFKQIQPPSVKFDTTGWNDWQTSKNSEGTGGGNKAVINTTGITGCSMPCGDYTKEGLIGNNTQKPGANTFLSQSLVDKLKNMQKTDPNFIINEAFPPTVDHSSACHFNGTCVDIGSTNSTPAELDKLCQAAKNAGLNILNEYGKYKASDFKVCPAPQTYSTTTGGHLHLY